MDPVKKASLRQVLLHRKQPQGDLLRVETRLIGRGVLDDGTEFDCETNEISTADISLVSKVRPVGGQRMVAYIEVFGGLEGYVAEPTPDGFRATLKVSIHKREKLVRQLLWLKGREALC